MYVESTTALGLLTSTVKTSTEAKAVSAAPRASGPVYGMDARADASASRVGTPLSRMALASAADCLR